MWIHTNATEAQVTASAGEIGDVWVIVNDQKGSQTHASKFQVFLEGMNRNSLAGSKRRRSNSGTHGAGCYWAATYNEWGKFLARLYEFDPTARTDGVAYSGVDDFHKKTGDKYRRAEAV